MSGLGQSLYMDGVQQGIQQGMQQGVQQGMLRTLCSLVRQELLQLTDAAKQANLSEQEFMELMDRENLTGEE